MPREMRFTYPSRRMPCLATFGIYGLPPPLPQSTSTYSKLPDTQSDSSPQWGGLCSWVPVSQCTLNALPFLVSFLKTIFSSSRRDLYFRHCERILFNFCFNIKSSHVGIKPAELSTLSLTSLVTLEMPRCSWQPAQRSGRLAAEAGHEGLTTRAITSGSDQETWIHLANTYWICFQCQALCLHLETQQPSTNK